MRVCFEEDADGDVTQIALWKAYESRFEEFVRQGKKLLAAADFIKNVTMAFRNAAAMVVTSPQGGQQKFIIKGIRPREVPLSLKGELYISCQWEMGHRTLCSGSFPSVQDLFSHILAVHVPPARTASVQPGEEKSVNGENGVHTNGVENGEKDSAETGDVPMIDAEAEQVAPEVAADAAPCEPMVYFCKWRSCGKFDPHGCTDRRKVAAHIKTHIPDAKHNQPNPFSGAPETAQDETSLSLNVTISQKLVFANRSTVVDEKGEATGIPLTSVLILRNIARSDIGKRYLKGYIQDLIGVAAVNVPLRNYISDLLDCIVEKQRGAIV